MTQPNPIDRYLPLSEATYYILLALTEPRHGYAVMQLVEQISQGTVKIGPGTLYGAFSQLEKEKLISKVSEDERRKSYQLTPLGQEVLHAQIARTRQMLLSAQIIDPALVPFIQ